MDLTSGLMGLSPDAVLPPGYTDPGEAHAAAPGSLPVTGEHMPQPGAAAGSLSAPGAPLQHFAAAAAEPTPAHALEPAPSEGADDRKRQLSASDDGGGPSRKQPYYFEFAKKKWEYEETFRLPDGTSWPEVQGCLIWLPFLLWTINTLTVKGQQIGWRPSSDSHSVPCQQQLHDLMAVQCMGRLLFPAMFS